MKAKIRALTHRTSQQDLRDVLIRLNQIMRGWANYFQHAVCKHTFEHPGRLHLVAGDPMLRARTAGSGRTSAASSPPHRAVAPITADGIELFNIATVPVTRYRYRGNKIPNPWAAAQPRLTAGTVESPVRGETHGGFGERPGETDRGQPRHRAPGRLNCKPDRSITTCATPSRRT